MLLDYYKARLARKLERLEELREFRDFRLAKEHYKAADIWIQAIISKKAQIRDIKQQIKECN